MSLEWTTIKPTEPGWYFEKIEGMKGYWLSHVYKSGDFKLYKISHAFRAVGTDQEKSNEYLRAMVQGHPGSLRLWYGPLADPETDPFVE